MSTQVWTLIIDRESDEGHGVEVFASYRDALAVLPARLEREWEQYTRHQVQRGLTFDEADFLDSLGTLDFLDSAPEVVIEAHELHEAGTREHECLACQDRATEARAESEDEDATLCAGCGAVDDEDGHGWSYEPEDGDHYCPTCTAKAAADAEQQVLDDRYSGDGEDDEQFYCAGCGEPSDELLTLHTVSRDAAERLGWPEFGTLPLCNSCAHRAS